MRVVNWMAGLGLALAIVGLAILPLSGPGFTRALSSRFSLAEEAGLDRQQMLEVAELVRALVVDGEGDTLPGTVGGRSGFDAAAVSHLIDVRRVLGVAKLVTGLVILIAVLWVALLVARRRFADIAAALRAGAVLSLLLIALAALAAVVDFDWFFSAFHAVLFRSGTWTFPYDSLLIQTFPEPFWATAGAAWALLTVLGAGLLGGLSRVPTTSGKDRSENGKSREA